MTKHRSKTQLISIKDEFDDVWELIALLKKDKKNISDYICRAIRFYKENSSKPETNLTEARVRLIVKEEMKILLDGMEIVKKDEELNIDNMLNNKSFEAAFSSFEESDDDN
ncbi:hypothetical protein [Maledivibacter halophilus]|uniref:Uncharacterized protein n=1 Tax=Maledivibacter halophilus TaxID=36842 RepID=A0A1T5MFA8_9FIRM|nr:hypothetical protein [Maledivibacter halophilus]SKC86931.1 hypothetical protein SAMN02194393_04599 [Maledivibacter halophilus]